MKKVTLACIACTLYGLSHSQTLSNEIEAVKQEVKNIGELFKSKKNKKKQANTPESEATNQGDGKGKRLQSAGEVHPNAVYLEVDDMELFNAGAAVVRKGNSTALIDRNGKFIVPFNKHSFQPYSTSSTTMLVGYGFFLTDRSAAVTSKGTVYNGFYDLTPDNQYAHTFENKKHTYIDSSGRRYVVDYLLRDISDGIGIGNVEVLTDNTFTTYPAYISLANKIISKKKYWHLSPFSEGLACVGNPDSYGMIKYGFINTKGEEVIPLTYSNQPSDFKNGLSKVVPTNKADFRYAFINKKGDIVVKHTDNDIRTNLGAEFEPFKNGYSNIGTRRIMDSTGKIYTQAEFCKMLGVPFSLFGGKAFSFAGPRNGKVVYSRAMLPSDKNPYNFAGFADPTTNTSTRLVFSTDAYKFSLSFDPVSKLALEKTQIGKDKEGLPIYRTGYINEEGVYVIIMAEKSKW